MADRVNQDPSLQRLQELKANVRDIDLLTNVLAPMNLKQQKYAARLENAIQVAIQNDHTCRDDLVRRLGFTIHQVRITPDLTAAHIRWACFPGNEEETAALLRTLQRQLVYLARRKYSSYTFPRIVWRCEALEESHAQLEAAFDDVAASDTTDAFESLLERVYGKDRAESLINSLDIKGKLASTAHRVERALRGDKELVAALEALRREERDLERRQLDKFAHDARYKPAVRARAAARLEELERDEEGEEASHQVDEAARREDALLASVPHLIDKPKKK